MGQNKFSAMSFEDMENAEINAPEVIVSSETKNDEVVATETEPAVVDETTVNSPVNDEIIETNTKAE